jgi:hypothetical protein
MLIMKQRKLTPKCFQIDSWCRVILRTATSARNGPTGIRKQQQQQQQEEQHPAYKRFGESQSRSNGFFSGFIFI